MIPQEWFLCIFARTLPWPSVLRVSFWSFDRRRRKMLIMSNVHHDDGDDNEMNDKVWDMFCCEGVKVLFRVALVLIKHALPRKVQHHSHRHPLQQHNSSLLTHPVVRSPNHYFWPPIGEPYYPSPRQTFLQTRREFCQFKSNVSLKLKSNAPGSPALPVNVRNIGGAETPARSHCSGGLSHPRGAKLQMQIIKMLLQIFSTNLKHESHRCSGLMSLRRIWKENTGQQCLNFSWNIYSTNKLFSFVWNER